MKQENDVQLKKYKEEFDFIHNKIGELEWKRATIFYGKKATFLAEIENIDIQLENYRENMEILIKEIRDYIQNKKEKMKNK